MAARRPEPPVAYRTNLVCYAPLTGHRFDVLAEWQLSKTANSHSRPVSTVGVCEELRKRWFIPFVVSLSNH